MWASALSLIVISVALERTYFHGSVRIAPTEPTKAPDARPNSPTPRAAANSRAARSPEASVQAGTVQLNSGVQQPTSLADSGVNRSVIGIPFPVSPSVDARCKLIKKVDLCERQHNMLAKMAQEPRDNSWATKTEALIQDEVMSEKPGVYSIRNIECRSSLCAVEVESLSDAYVGESYDFLNPNNLVDGFRMGGAPETDDLGRQVSVTFLLFLKWSSYKAFYENPSALPRSN
jgi:hypothetical protein